MKMFIPADGTVPTGKLCSTLSVKIAFFNRFFWDIKSNYEATDNVFNLS